MVRPRLLSWVLLAMLLPVVARADPLPSLAVPHSPRPPLLNASPDDPAWKTAAEIPALAPSLLLGDKMPTPPPTRVSVLWDRDFLYVRFVCEDHDVYTPFSDRDAPHYQGDVAEVFLDPVGDGRQYFEFELSPRGGIFDQYFVLTAEPRSDEYGRLVPEVAERDLWSNLSWNCDGLKTAAKILRQGGQDSGWIAEFALPAAALLKRLGRKEFGPQALRANFLRYDWQPKPGEKDRDLAAANWSAVVRGCPHLSPSRMGLLRLEPTP